MKEASIVCRQLDYRLIFILPARMRRKKHFGVLTLRSNNLEIENQVQLADGAKRAFAVLIS